MAGLGEMWSSLAGLQIPAQALSELQSNYLKQASELWNSALPGLGAGLGGVFGASQGEAAKEAAPKPKPLSDRRFAAEAWSANPASSFVAQLYLLNARTLQQMADKLEGEAKTRERIRFAVQQFVDAASPSNYLALNPEAQKLALDTQGESIAKGMQQLWADIQRGHLSQTDESAFEVGRNVATSEGAVVFENDFFQLIEYKPLTATVHARPFLLVPPCINKYYILDLQPENSLIRYAVEQGHRVFVLSWRNPDASCAAWTWDEVIENAPIKAIEVVQDITGAEQIDTLGFCVGGTILATALAVLAARGQQPASSLTLLTTLIDFSSNGVLDIFIDEAMVKMREMSLGDKSMGNPKGPALLKGQELAATFSFLRPNDLVWNYVVGNYLKGEAPPAFDLLYWNGDSTNMAGPMYCWYLRHTYLQNELKIPGRLTICGEKLDLGLIEAPVYIYGSREDHIVPWDAAYRSTQVFKGPKRFVLGASGHIAGVINPPAKGKRSHWLGKTAALPATSEQWFEGAVEHPGSWWTDWAAWLASHAGPKVAAPKGPGSRQYPVIEPAPGRYVKQKA
ncbi:class I poly(R)-hydroxyalkanoic acid synthase [Paucibacter sp. DJ2R-2]|uniref:class I poly(R)-hydroxyalkanoic acid synthase n=1 Tax=Paucibacter sp. DJ2R-2 TaxID=2893558 RepID=UPI0021E4205D|nr:class I poly(R)-hydroxyalkanoic acid synthase [Paucibacter sp. DJ2R-2]MCV2421559.1 class I poly(R)-hydroxyalkanoic acid synthase [Paucibacter sp. DJ4R-1]MCV2438264.1 class I poly(R)-hydroxyalkanoic acid synthase [Paucibacter sp. DJ2R-2]